MRPGLANFFCFFLGWYIIYRCMTKIAGPSPFGAPIGRTFTSAAQSGPLAGGGGLVLFFASILVNREYLVLEAADGIGLFLAALAAWLSFAQRQKGLIARSFACLIFNEKVSIVIFGLFLADLLMSRRGTPGVNFSAAPLRRYFFLQRAHAAPSGQEQVEMDLLAKLGSYLTTAATPRGRLVNLAPTLICFGNCSLAANRENALRTAVILFLLFAASVQAEVVLNLGRIVMFRIPCIPFCFLFCLDAHRREKASEAGAQGA